ncbi:MAG: hypothetical protein A2097_13460 [Desulfobacula sp. GWF2_41_7]|nr:MAG: hypothetical protein A2097_13460 [Desulfobacula sp. GWF2_41_7]
MQKLVIAISTLFLFWGCVSSNTIKPQKHNEISSADQPSQIITPQEQYDLGKNTLIINNTITFPQYFL